MRSRWAAYACTVCGSLVTAKGYPGATEGTPTIVAIFPDIWQADDALPARVSKYLSQARSTLSSPDASVLMSAASIDAMLKHHGLAEGKLYSRINEGVASGLLTKALGTWAHRVRLDANNPRHADQDVPHISPEDAERAFEYAEALAQYLFVLPSKMPEATEPSQPENSGDG